MPELHLRPPLRQSTYQVRVIWSCTLLSLVILQWVMGTLFLRMTLNVVDTTSAMTVTEQRLSEEIRSVYGFAPKVQLIDEVNLNYLAALGYSAPFILSHDVAGHFMIDESGPALAHAQVLVGGKLHQDQKDAGQTRICIDRLFALFCVDFAPAMTGTCSTQQVTHLFGNQTLTDLCTATLLCPPPEALA